jgi:hypothetical protein
MSGAACPKVETAVRHESSMRHAMTLAVMSENLVFNGTSSGCAPRLTPKRVGHTRIDDGITGNTAGLVNAGFALDRRVVPTPKAQTR